MRDQLQKYVELLFAGNAGAEEIKEEILQNTLDRYDDLIAQGKSPEAAYRLAITGIGDVSEILNAAAPEEPSLPEQVPQTPGEREEKKKRRKLLRSVAVGLYILCAAPVLIFQNEVGVVLLLVLVAVATGLIIFAGKDDYVKQEEETPQQKMRRSIYSAISAVFVVLYFILSFTTGAWHITWLIFPILGAVKGLVGACLDLKEEKE